MPMEIYVVIENLYKPTLCYFFLCICLCSYCRYAYVFL